MHQSFSVCLGANFEWMTLGLHIVGFRFCYAIETKRALFIGSKSYHLLCKPIRKNHELHGFNIDNSSQVWILDELETVEIAIKFVIIQESIRLNVLGG